MLVNVSAGPDIKNAEYNTACQVIYDIIDPDRVVLKIGLIIDKNMGDTLRVTVVATGIEDAENGDFLFGKSAGGSYTQVNDLFGMQSGETELKPPPLPRETTEEREPYRGSDNRDNHSGGFSLASLLRKRTR